MFLQDAKAAFFVASLLGFLILFCLALISLFRGRRNPTNLLFAGICLLGALLTGNSALVALIPGQNTALLIYRFTYFLFVFSYGMKTVRYFSFKKCVWFFFVIISRFLDIRTKCRTTVE